MLIDVIAVHPRSDFHLELTFQNGERRCFDMRPLFTVSPWQRLTSLELFQRVRVAHGTVAWPGNIDIAPETLYDDSMPC